MADVKLYTTDELKKMSAKDRNKLASDMQKEMAQLTLNIRTGKEKQSHLKQAWKKQLARIQTFNRASAPSNTESNEK